MLTVSSSPKRPVPADLIVRFGPHADGGAVLNLPMPVLGGVADEVIFCGVRERPSIDGWRLFERDGLLIGAIDEPAEVDLDAQAHRLYAQLLVLVGERRLARIWNYVPRINEPDATGLENYRAFCRGRSLAFEERLGAGYEQHLPAASAVGGVDGRLSVIFAATRDEPKHVENPEQVPAYAYPPEHGPRAPSFTRATRVTAAGERYVFISGTAAIKGHATVAVGDLAGQITCMIDNLKLVSRACGLGEDLGLGGAGSAVAVANAGPGAARRSPEWQRHFKVYLRDDADYAEAAKMLQAELFVETDRVTWLHSDICRAALLIEIEATLVAAV